MSRPHPSHATAPLLLPHPRRQDREAKADEIRSKYGLKTDKAAPEPPSAPDDADETQKKEEKKDGCTIA